MTPRPSAFRILPLFLLAACSLAQAGAPLTDADAARLKKVRVQTHVVFERYEMPETGSIGLIGFKYDLFVTRGLYWGPAVYGAVAGERGGYGVAALGLGYAQDLASWLYWDTRLLAGSGGGSGVKTGGGFLLHGVTGLMFNVMPGLRGALHAGYLDFPTGDFRAPVVSFAFVFTGTKVILPD